MSALEIYAVASLAASVMFTGLGLYMALRHKKADAGLRFVYPRGGHARIRR